MPEVPQIPCPLGHAQPTFFVAKGIIPSAETDLLKSPTLLGKNLSALSIKVQMALLHTLNPFIKGVTSKNHMSRDRRHVWEEKLQEWRGRNLRGIEMVQPWTGGIPARITCSSIHQRRTLPQLPFVHPGLVTTNQLCRNCTHHTL